MKATGIIRLAAVLSVFWIAAFDGSPAPAAELETMTRKVAKKFTEVRQLSTADLAAWLADPERKPPQLLDAREPAEFAVSYLCGAIRVDPDASARNSCWPESTVHAQTMNLEGSIFKWANEGRPLVRDGKPAYEVHRFEG